MRKNFKYMITRCLGVLFIIGTMFSCNDDFFNAQPGNHISPDVHYQSVIDLQTSLEGVLVPLQEVFPKMIVLDGLRTDLMDITPNFNSDFSDVYNQKFQPGNSLLDFSGLYKVIISANEIMANIDRVRDADPSFDELFEKQIKGTVVGVRSWAYFQLIKLNGEVAYIPDNLVELPSGMMQTYVSRDAMIDTLINQLTGHIHRDQSVVELMMGYYPNNKALLGELWLEKNQYDSAVYYLKTAMESYGNTTGMYKIDKTYQKEGWANIIVGGMSSATENIGVIPFSAAEGQPNPLAGWMLPIDQYLVKPSQVLYNLYKSQIQLKKVVGDQYRGIGVTVDTLFNANQTYISKYSLLEGIDAYGTDLIFMRCADIHLKLAEALNRRGESNIALALLNQGFSAEKKKPTGYSRWASNVGVRGRAYLESRTVPAEVTDPAQIMEMVEDFIIEERAMELAFEGSRMFDLIRIAKRRGNTDYLATRIAAKYPLEKQEEIKNFLRNEQNWNLPFYR